MILLGGPLGDFTLQVTNPLVVLAIGDIALHKPYSVCCLAENDYIDCHHIAALQNLTANITIGLFMHGPMSPCGSLHDSIT